MKKAGAKKEMAGMLSTAEIAMGCKMAMRGGGCQWGMAEEAGYAAAWLAGRGLFSPLAFAEVINNRAQLSSPQSINKLSPLDGFGAQCPVCLGAFLSDRLEGLTKDKPLLMRNVKSPLLAAACLAQAARANMCMSWRGGGIVINNKKRGAIVYGNVQSAFAPVVKLQSANNAMMAKITKQKTLCKTSSPSCIPATDNNWKQLIQWTKKTMVASSQTSTIKGAGAGLTDND